MQIKTKTNAATTAKNTYLRVRRYTYGFLTGKWTGFWMHYAGLGCFGRIATRFATWFVPPHKARPYIAFLNTKGFIAPSVTIYHDDLCLGANVFMDERVVIFQRENAGSIILGDRVFIYRDTILESGYGGYMSIGNDSSIHPRCQLNAYVSPIQIGCRVMIAPNCAFYPYDHGVEPGQPICEQPLHTKGGITIDDDAWIGFGVIVLSGVRIGKGAVVGAGSVVTQDVPDNAIAAGVPARIIKYRSDLS